MAANNEDFELQLDTIRQNIGEYLLKTLFCDNPTRLKQLMSFYGRMLDQLESQLQEDF
jgi:hypothetical protein